MESTFKNHSLCIIIPMYNEEQGVAICIDSVITEIRSLHFPIKLLVVNDGSKDKTRTILKEKEREYGKNLIIVNSKTNQGYGKALQRGIREAVKEKFEYGLFMDSDLTNDPKYIKKFAEFMNENFDCVKASRYITGGKVIGVPIFRRVISIIANTIASSFFHVGVKDCTNGFRMVRLALIKDIQFQENSFPIIMEEMYFLKKKHAKFAEAPITLTARKSTKSHFTYRPKMFYDYIKYPVKSIFL